MKENTAWTFTLKTTQDEEGRLKFVLSWLFEEGQEPDTRAEFAGHIMHDIGVWLEEHYRDEHAVRGSDDTH